MPVQGVATWGDRELRPHSSEHSRRLCVKAALPIQKCDLQQVMQISELAFAHL